MNAASPVRLEFHDSIARIILDQPGSRANVLNSAMWSALRDAVTQVADRSDVDGLLILSAKDGIFLAGADLHELSNLPIDDHAPARQVVRNGLEVLAALESLLIPTAAAIDGAALGGGFEVALACDYRLGGTHPKIKLGLPEVKLGLIPGWGGTQRLPRVIGAGRAAELLVTGRAVNGPEGLELGLIDRVVESSKLIEEAHQVLLNAPSSDWETRRARKQSPYQDAVDLSAARAIVPSLSDDERPAAEAALRVVENGASLALVPALKCESDEFVPLLLGPIGRRRMKAFLKR